MHIAFQLDDLGMPGHLVSKGNKPREVAKIVSVFSVVGKQVSISTDNIEQGNGACSAIQHWSILKSNY